MNVPDDSSMPLVQASQSLLQDIMVIGASAGGIAALRRLVADLPADFPGSVLIVMHLSPESPGSLPDLLSTAGPLRASNAADGEVIEPGRIYVAPPDHHLTIDMKHVLRVVRGPKENRSRPAIDPLFRSAAVVFGPRAVGVVLTGNLDDGTAGLAAIKQAGGTTIVQDPAEAEAPSMPRSALRHVDVDHCLRLEEIPPVLVRLADTPARIKERAMASPTLSDIQIEADIAVDEHASRQVLELGDPSIFTCPECHGALIRLRDRSLVRFRCHTGHAFGPESLDAALTETIEDALWNAVRALQEQAMLYNHLVEHASGDDRKVELRKRSQEALHRANHVRQALPWGRDQGPQLTQTNAVVPGY
jgi:two-component system chemotaxis response regulator CheB